MRNIAIIILSVLLAAAIISGLILYHNHIDAKAALLLSEKSLLELNEEVSKLNQETSVLRDQIHKNVESLMELKTAKDRISGLEQTIEIKDKLISELNEGLNTLKKRHKEEEVAKDAIVAELQHKLMGLKGQKALAETKKSEIKSTYEVLISDLKRQIENQEVTIRAFEQKISVTFVDRILFEFGKTAITPEGKKILQKLGEALKYVYDKKIRVVGHTDNIPILPEYHYRLPSNWELSACRSAAVIRYLHTKMGLDPSKLEAVGRSFYEPIASNRTREGRAQNRRVEIIISP